MTNEERDALIEEVRASADKIEQGHDHLGVAKVYRFLLGELDEARAALGHRLDVVIGTLSADLAAQREKRIRADERARAALPLRNVLALSRRLHRHGVLSDEDAGHFARFCASGGVEPSVLRDADEAAAASEHERRVRAPIEAERDQFAAALAEVMTPRGIYDAWSLNRVLRRLADAADHLLNDHSCDRHGYEGVVCARDAARDHAAAIEKLSIPADLAAQREARVRADERAKALREAADVCRSGITEGTPAGWSHCAERIRAMVDEAERGTR